MPDDTGPHHRKIHSHRSGGPVAVATIILEEETLAINYMCAFHLRLCGGEPPPSPRATSGGNARVTRRQRNLPADATVSPSTSAFHWKPNYTQALLSFHLYAPLTLKQQPWWWWGGRQDSLNLKSPCRGGGWDTPFHTNINLVTGCKL